MAETVTLTIIEELPLIKGDYKHFKGGIYYAYDLAIDTKTNSPVVLYMSYQDNTKYTRPYDEFFGEAVVQDIVNDEVVRETLVPRFELIKAEE